LDRSDFPPLRSIPRAFIGPLPEELPARIELPQADADKFRKVLRLGTGDLIALLPGDGRLVVCRLCGKDAEPVKTHLPATEAGIRVTLALAFPKPEKLEESVRMATELGVAGFILFHSDRTVVKWDAPKRDAKLRRLSAIAREAAEVAFRVRLPEFYLAASLDEVLASHPDAKVLSESETAAGRLQPDESMVLVVGPEGGWSPRESALVGDRAVTLGPRVLRVDTAVAAACALALSEKSRPGSSVG
jgi:16S rRNA (uracil1498-N3)-methyltransferase